MTMIISTRFGQSYHQRPKVGCKVQCVVRTTLMKKHDVGDDLGLRGLEKGQRKNKTIQT